ncbi:hypothetical protein HNY73_006630 [Argiope bruennichi]|uniref:Uncharacterized protein n=1 Tax=Argiope bruennichi TaxID=94029 RepID=A0A8T0FIF2_ARGBR|nr:hypothetical protein HNY73_006630 [Argiope bruennichi]
MRGRARSSYQLRPGEECAGWRRGRAVSAASVEAASREVEQCHQDQSSRRNNFLVDDVEVKCLAAIFLSRCIKARRNAADDVRFWKKKTSFYWPQ